MSGQLNALEGGEIFCRFRRIRLTFFEIAINFICHLLPFRALSEAFFGFHPNMTSQLSETSMR
jgi:hypothetical protein